ncbi:MAG: V-type ATPase subunit [Clostridia bacterium]|nr:V-type ATPase subunit [Clostridia bacterium]
MKDGLIFANTRAKAKELNLFSEERLLRMMECAALVDAVRILFEANYGGGLIVDNENDFEKVLLEEQRLATEFAKEAAPADIGFECFFLRNDYHNIKSLLKAKYGGIADVTPLIMPDGIYAYGELKSAIDSNRLDYTPHLAEATATIDKRFEAGEGGPRIIDTLIDKAMFMDITDRLKKGVDTFVKEYFTALIDTTNILSLLRVFNIGEKMSFFAGNYLEGGSLDIKTFVECASDPYNKLPVALRGTPYHDLTAKIERGELSVYETSQDNYLLKIFSVSKNDMFSVAPIIGYYLAKQNEIKVIRVVLVCIKNKVSKEDMKKRVRMLYA